MIQFGVRINRLLPLTRGGWRKAAQILIREFEHETRFPQALVNKRESEGRRGKRDRREKNTSGLLQWLQLVRN